MGRFRFRLQRILDYRTSLVEAQEAEVARCLLSLRLAEAKLAGIRARQRRALQAMRNGAQPRADLDAGRAAMQWNYLDALREREATCLRKIEGLSQELTCAREKLAQLKQEEQVMEKLRSRQQRRAEAAGRLQETKELDDLTATRYATSRQEVHG